MTTTLDRPNVSRSAAGFPEAPTTDARNVYQRKLAVMAKCDVIAPDSKYDAVSKQSGARIQFPYLSVQYISNQLRRFAVEEGLDITASVAGELVIVVLTNVDVPSEQITATWPLVPNDKAWAYSTKYALIRTFLIGDGTEGDEAENAANSGQSSPATHQTQPSVARQGTVPASGQGALCVFCSEMDYKTARGLSPKLWVANKGPAAGFLQCDGRLPDGGWCNHPAPTSAAEDEAASQAPDFGFEGEQP